MPVGLHPNCLVLPPVGRHAGAVERMIFCANADRTTSGCRGSIPQPGNRSWQSLVNPGRAVLFLDVLRRMQVELQPITLVVAGSNPVGLSRWGTVAQSGRARMTFHHTLSPGDILLFAVNADETTGRRTRPSGRGPRTSKGVCGARVQIPVRQRMAEKERFITPRHCTLMPAIQRKEFS